MMSRLALLAAHLVAGGCSTDRPDVVTADAERAILSQLRRLIAKMPKGSKVLVMPYYGDPGSGRKLKYPFDSQELYSHCSQYDVILGIQKAG
jgi:hypothetical protein